MKFYRVLFLLLIVATSSTRCMAQENAKTITIGAQRTDVYLPLLKEKKVAYCINHILELKMIFL